MERPDSHQVRRRLPGVLRRKAARASARVRDRGDVGVRAPALTAAGCCGAGAVCLGASGSPAVIERHNGGAARAIARPHSDKDRLVATRLTILIKAKLSRLLDRAEDPRETLDYGYAGPMEQLTGLRNSILEVVTAKK